MFVWVGLAILAIVVGSVIYAMVAMRASDRRSTRMTAFGEAPEDDPNSSNP